MEVTKKRLVIGAVALFAIAALVTAAVLAVLQDPTNTSTGNNFTSGKISLTIDKPNGILSWTNASNGGMAPGDQTTGEVAVSNDAPAGAQNRLRYAITVTTTGTAALISQLQLTVRRGDGNQASGACALFNGSILYQGTILGAGVVSGGTRRLVGSPGTGKYDDGSAVEPFRDDRELDAGTAERLCFAVSMNETATGVGIESPASVTSVFDFVAEQTVNNTGAETISGAY
jgi:hypothetical protein